MKRHLFPLMLVSVIVAGCNDETKEPGEGCSVHLSGIHFTRSLNGASGLTSIDNDKLTMSSGPKTDYFNEPDGSAQTGTAPMLLAKVDNTKPFTLTAKVRPTFTTTYDAGTLYVFSNEDRWQKFAFEKDEQARTRIVSVRTIGTSDDNNHDVITGESAYLRISSDASQIGFYYSTDGATWNLARIYKNDYPNAMWVGISSQSPIGDGTITDFESCVLSPKSVTDFRKGI